MNTLHHISSKLAVAAILLGGTSLSGQDTRDSAQPAASPATETRGEHRDKALWIDEARPTGAFGMENAPAVEDRFMDVGFSTIKNAGWVLLGLVVLWWWRRRRTVRYT